MQILPHPHLHLHPHSLSSSSSSSTSNGVSPLSLLPNLSFLSLSPLHRPTTTTIIRMGGGPRTYPGGVSKWQWKRMQAKKSKQLLKARLSRERHIYEMRKRAELKAAVSDLERPWEVVEKAAPKSSGLFAVSADEQLKVLADRFQKPGGFDMWSDDDGPQLFETFDGLPTARFFPKGVVHSVRPYGRIGDGGDEERDGRSLSWGLGKGSFGGEIEEGIGEDFDFPGSRGSYGGDDEGRGHDVRSLTRGQQGGYSRGGTRNSRGRGNGRSASKLGNGSFGDEIEEGSGEESDISGSRVYYGDHEGRGHDVRSVSRGEEGGYYRGGLRNLRGRGNGRSLSRGLGNGSFGGGIEEGSGEEFDFSGSRGSYGDDEGRGHDVRTLGRGEERGYSRGGLRNSRGRGNGRSSRGQGKGRNLSRGLGNGSGDGNESSGEEFNFSGLKASHDDEEGGGRYVRNPNHGEQRGGYLRGGLRNSRGRGNGRNSSRGLRNSSFGGETKELSGEDSRFSGSRVSNGGYNGSDQRRSKHWTARDSRKDVNGVEFRSWDENSEKVMDLEGRKANSGIRSDSSRRLSSRGRNAGRSRRSKPEDIYDMSLQHDGTYGFSASNDDAKLA